MAAKKKSTAKKAPAAKATAAKKAAATKVQAPSVAARTLGSLPALTGKLRAGFRAAFTDEQCKQWGERTKAENVIKEAERWISTMARALKDDTASAYSRRRLTFLCELVVLLEDEVARTTTNGASVLRSTRTAALSVAVEARRELARLIRAVAGGHQKTLSDLAAITPANESSNSDVQGALTATIALAVRLRRDEAFEAVADDAGLTEDRLNSAYAALEALTGASEVALNAAAYEGDAPSVNVIEGRVLREMKLAQRLLNEARERDVNVPALVAGPSLRQIFGKTEVDDPAPTPPPP